MPKRALRDARSALQAGDPRAALLALQGGLERAPDDGGYWLQCGVLLGRLGQHETAVAVLHRATQLLPRSAGAFTELGMAMARAGHRDGPEACYRRAAALAPEDPSPRTKLGHTLVHQARFDEAEQAFRQAHALAPSQPEPAIGLATVLEARKELGAAASLLEPLLGGADPVAATTWARIQRRRGEPERGLPPLKAALERAADEHMRSLLLHALGDSLDALGRADEAFEAYAEANRGRGLRFDPQQHTRQLEALAQQLSSQRMAALARGSSTSELPTLIVGMPRSGTTLLEQALSAHPGIAAGGELEDLRDLAREAYAGPITSPRLDTLAARYLGRLRAIGPEAQRVTDKMPHNFLHLGLVALMLPRARVIHCRRDPVDTCWSCFRQHFGAGLAYTTDLAWLGAFHRSYADLMEHWRGALPLAMLEVDYEELVAQPEPTLRRVLAFLDLPWHPACLEPHKARRIAATVSRAEVQRPIHQGSVGRAAPYRPHLGPLLDALSRGEREGA